MAGQLEIAPVLAAYPADCQPIQIEPLGSAGGFSGASFWRLSTPRGPLCLRRWPAGYPELVDLQFIQAVLWHVERSGFERVPLPLETKVHTGYVQFDGSFWELAPWMPGAADYHIFPSEARLTAAMQTLARFHLAADGFPLADIGPARSPGFTRRRERFLGLRSGGLKKLAAAIEPARWPELAKRGHRLLELFPAASDRAFPLVERATRLFVGLQPCIRDIWHDHVLFSGDAVTGLIDFGSLRPDNVSTDISRLLGSLVADNPTQWAIGLAAYESVRPLSEDERLLVTAFDQTTVILGGLQWLEWVFLQRKTFGDRLKVEQRLDQAIRRLEHLVN